MAAASTRVSDQDGCREVVVARSSSSSNDVLRLDKEKKVIKFSQLLMERDFS
jgi:hypothetical protein